jgi:hypothetical protein
LDVLVLTFLAEEIDDVLLVELHQLPTPRVSGTSACRAGLDRVAVD